MADDCSCLWYLSDDQLLTHFSARYPQKNPWHLYHLQPMWSSLLMSGLSTEQPSLASLKDIKTVHPMLGTFGATFAMNLATTLISTRSAIQLSSSKSLPSASAMANDWQAVDPHQLLQYLPWSITWARCWCSLGPQIHASPPQAILMYASNANSVATPTKTPH